LAAFVLGFLAFVRAEAKESGPITLVSGGRIYIVNVDEVRAAEAAANNVEITTPGKTLLARITFRELERLLAAAGNFQIRIHCSCFVHKADINALKPNSDGRASLVLSDGSVRQVRRSDRASLRDALAQTDQAPREAAETS